MRIGMDASRAFVSEKTGTETYSFKLLEAMIASGGSHELLVYTRGDDAPPVAFRRRGVLIHRIGWPRLWTQGGLGLRTFIDRLSVLFVPAHTLPVVRKQSLPTVVTIHGLEHEYLPEYYRYPQKFYLTWSTRYAVRWATRIIAVSQFTADELVKHFAADPEKIVVIHEGVDIEVYRKSYSDSKKQAVLRKLEVEKPYILFVGVVQPRKNLVRLIQAFSQVVAGTRARKLSLVIAGKLGWMYDPVLAAPKQFGVEGKVRFVDFVGQEHLRILLQEAELLAMPSLTEGFGLPVLEAMAAGTPVVAAQAGALPEVVGSAGLLVDPHSVEELSNAMRLLLSESSLREGLREKGLARARRFSWKRAANETLAVLGEAANFPA